MSKTQLQLQQLYSQTTLKELSKKLHLSITLIQKYFKMVGIVKNAKRIQSSNNEEFKNEFEKHAMSILTIK